MMCKLKLILGVLLALLFFTISSPAAARWISVDPVQANPNTGADFNRYRYANNNPYKFTDPDGRQSREFNWENQRLGTTPPQIENAPNLAIWGAVEVLCGFCDLNYVAPNGSGALQSVVTPFETVAATGTVAVGKVAIKIASDPKALFLAGSLITGDTDVAEALAAAASRKAESALTAQASANATKSPMAPPPPPKPTPPPPPPPPPKPEVTKLHD